jgi:hypothetical protein
MSKVLSEGLYNAIQEVIGHLSTDTDKDSFVTTEEPDKHPYKHVLELKSYLGDEDITSEEAKQLLKTDLKGNVYIGVEGEGYENIDEDWNGELAMYEQCKLWV